MDKVPVGPILKILRVKLSLYRPQKAWGKENYLFVVGITGKTKSTGRNHA